MWEGIDVREALAAIVVPTLVLHRRDDRPHRRSAPRAKWPQRSPAPGSSSSTGSTTSPTSATSTNGSTRSKRSSPGSTSRRRHDRRISCDSTRFTPSVGSESPATASTCPSHFGARVVRGCCASASPPRPAIRSHATCSPSSCGPTTPTPSRLSARLSVQLSEGATGPRRRRHRRSRLGQTRPRHRLSRSRPVPRRPYATRRADEVAAIHRGPFLPEDIYEPWAEGPHERARADYLDALAALADQAATRHDHAHGDRPRPTTPRSRSLQQLRAPTTHRRSRRLRTPRRCATRPRPPHRANARTRRCRN